MAHELRPIDIGSMPELARLAEEVHATGKPRRLRRDTEDVAILVPVPPKRRRIPRHISEADRADFLASAGSWKNVDTDKLVADIYDSRRSSRPPVEL